MLLSHIFSPTAANDIVMSEQSVDERSIWSHIVHDLNTLQYGDHIYRRLDSNPFNSDYYHGIVLSSVHAASTHKDDVYDSLIFTTTKDLGICIITLKQFAENFQIRKAYYGATKLLWKCHREGTCYMEPALPTHQITDNISDMSSYMDSAEKTIGSNESSEQPYDIKQHRARLHKMNKSIVVYCIPDVIDDQIEALIPFWRNLNVIDDSSTMTQKSEKKSDASCDGGTNGNDDETDSDNDDNSESGDSCDGSDISIGTINYLIDDIFRTFKMDDYYNVVKLKPGDHVYRSLLGYKKIFGDHHGVVSQVPEIAIEDIKSDPDLEENEKKEELYLEYLNSTIVYDMTSKGGISKRTLKDFKQNLEIGIVLYGVSKLHIGFPGTSHIEKKLPVKKVLCNVELYCIIIVITTIKFMI